MLQGKHIFIVEDNILNRVVYQITIGTQGAYLQFDRWGREAVDRLKPGRRWDLIILDLMLTGGISGFDIFNELRLMPEYNKVPIVAISASEPAVAMPKAMDLGFSGFISKPIDEAHICKQIAQLIAGEEVWYDGTFTTR